MEFTFQGPEDAFLVVDQKNGFSLQHEPLLSIPNQVYTVFTKLHRTIRISKACSAEPGPYAANPPRISSSAEERPILGDMKGSALFCAVLLVSSVVSAAETFREEGFASWYAGKFHGRTTANGEIFDTNLLTAAHKTLPFGSRVQVTNLENEKSVIVRINDRGPFVEDRIIDLSRAAADAIGLTNAGVAKVRLDVLHLEKEEPFTTLQIASYSNQDNAIRQKKRLADAGFSPSLETGSNGLTRVLLENLPVAGIEETKKRLLELGFGNVVVRSRRP